jgi:hypothetical protein
VHVDPLWHSTLQASTDGQVMSHCVFGGQMQSPVSQVIVMGDPPEPPDPDVLEVVDELPLDVVDFAPLPLLAPLSPPVSVRTTQPTTSNAMIEQSPAL